jgi:hypothetical protein
MMRFTQTRESEIFLLLNEICGDLYGLSANTKVWVLKNWEAQVVVDFSPDWEEIETLMQTFNENDFARMEDAWHQVEMGHLWLMAKASRTKIERL